jgi:hypothetical protein
MSSANMSLTYILGYCSMASVLPPLVLAFVQLKKLTNGLKVLFWLLVASCAADVISFELMSQRISTFPVFNLYLLVQFALVSLLFYKELNGLRLIAYVAFIATGLHLVNTGFIQGATNLNTYSNALFSTLGITYVCIYLYMVLNDLKYENISKSSMFWVAFGLLTAFCGTFFLFLLSNFLSQDKEIYQLAWLLAPISNIAKNILFTVGLWLNFKGRS